MKKTVSILTFKIFFIFLIAPVYGQYQFSDRGWKPGGSGTPLRVVAELNIGDSQEVKLCNGDIVKLSLIEITEVRDSVRNAIRAAYVKVSVDGEEITLKSGN